MSLAVHYMSYDANIQSSRDSLFTAQTELTTALGRYNSGGMWCVLCNLLFNRTIIQRIDLIRDIYEARSIGIIIYFFINNLLSSQLDILS